MHETFILRCSIQHTVFFLLLLFMLWSSEMKIYSIWLWFVVYTILLFLELLCSFDLCFGFWNLPQHILVGLLRLTQCSSLFFYITFARP